jgi:hypothetical protein
MLKILIKFLISCESENILEDTIILKVWLFFEWTVQSKHHFIWIHLLHQFIKYMNSFICCQHWIQLSLFTTNNFTFDIIKVQRWQLYTSHYNHETTNIALELKISNLNTDTTKEWEYQLHEKFWNCLIDQAMMSCFLTFMEELIRNLIFVNRKHYYYNAVFNY